MAVTDPTQLFDVRDKVVIVTGASSGLGERFTRTLHAAGAQVVAVARRQDRLESLAAECEGLVVHAVDVTDEEKLAAMVEDVISAFGRVDVLVNNAGMGISAPALEESLDDFRYVLEVNLVGLFALSRLTARHMVSAGQGSIINIASVYGLGAAWPIPNAAYTSAKAGVVNLTRELSGQWGGGNVRVNAIAPGFFPSEATTELVSNEKAVARLTRRTSLRRLGAEHELDGALIFLASDASSYVTGQTLVVDGGYTSL